MIPLFPGHSASLNKKVEISGKEWYNYILRRYSAEKRTEEGFHPE